MSVISSSARMMLETEEGKRRYPYYCTARRLTIGIGWNLSDNGLPDEIIELLFEISLERAEASARNVFGVDFLESISEFQYLAILNLIFNLGESGLRHFVDTLYAIRSKCWIDAVAHLKDSLYYRQVPKRVDRICELLLGRWPY